MKVKGELQDLNEQGEEQGCLTPVFSQWDTTAASQCPCSLSRVNSVRVTEEKGPK